MTVNVSKYCALCVLVYSLLGSSAYSQQTHPHPGYLDPLVPIERRIDDLLPRMTIEEKVSQIYDHWGSASIPRLES